LYDITGKLYTQIDEVNASNVRILTNELKDGIYIINISTETGNVSKRVIKK
jgi:type IX secretion system substrate protein